jgi:hypothetical protein
MQRELISHTTRDSVWALETLLIRQILLRTPYSVDGFYLASTWQDLSLSLSQYTPLELNSSIHIQSGHGLFIFKGDLITGKNAKWVSIHLLASPPFSIKYYFHIAYSVIALHFYFESFLHQPWRLTFHTTTTLYQPVSVTKHGELDASAMPILRKQSGFSSGFAARPALLQPLITLTGSGPSLVIASFSLARSSEKSTALQLQI